MSVILFWDMLTCLINFGLLFFLSDRVLFAAAVCDLYVFVQQLLGMHGRLVNDATETLVRDIKNILILNRVQPLNYEAPG